MQKGSRLLTTYLCLLCQTSRTMARLRPTRRHFTSTRPSQLRTSELTEDGFASLRAKPDRLWSDIHHSAQWGMGKRYGDGPEQTGMARLTLSNADKQVREWFVRTTEALSCKTHVDAVGNMYSPGSPSQAVRIDTLTG